MLKLILLFVGIPFIEMLLLVKMGETLGFWNTVLIILTTGVIGASLTRAQGLTVLRKINEELQYGRMPARELIDGLLIFAGGIVLLTPGLLTDMLGFLILIPWTRNIFKRWLKHKIEERLQKGNVQIITD